jgi:hypothetical protein
MDDLAKKRVVLRSGQIKGNTLTNKLVNGLFMELFMRSSLHDLLPPPTRRALAKLGHDLATARRKRRFTVAMMVERMGVATNTYRRVENGDPTVAMGAYAMALFVLGFGNVLGELVDPRRDELGLQLDEAHLPKRVRAKKQPTPL